MAIPPSTSHLVLKNEAKNHWVFTPEDPTQFDTNYKIAQYILESFKQESFPDKLSPVFTWRNGENQKGKAVYNLISTSKIPCLYFPESEKTMNKNHTLRGQFKTGRAVEAFFINEAKIEKNSKRLLLFKNQRSKTNSDWPLKNIRRDITIAMDLSKKTSCVRAPLDIFNWVSEKGTLKTGFICTQEIDLHSLFYREESFHSKLIKPIRRSIQRQLAVALDEILTAGYFPTDLKLENVLLAKNNRVFMIDFDLFYKKEKVSAAGGTLSHLSPEHALLLYLETSQKYKPTPEAASACMNENTISYSLAILFILIDASFKEHIKDLTPLVSSIRQKIGKGDPAISFLQEKFRSIPESFLDHLQKIDPNLPKPSYETQKPIELHGTPGSWKALLEGMLASDPRDRPSIKEVIRQFDSIAEQEEGI
jgi:serine/threonine protein kinase